MLTSGRDKMKRDKMLTSGREYTSIVREKSQYERPAGRDTLGNSTTAGTLALKFESV